MIKREFISVEQFDSRIPKSPLEYPFHAFWDFSIPIPPVLKNYRVSSGNGLKCVEMIFPVPREYMIY